MGMVICDKHGMTGIKIQVDEKIIQDILLDKKCQLNNVEQEIFVLRVDYMIDDVEDEKWHFNYFLSPLNYNKSLLERFKTSKKFSKNVYLINSDEEEEKFKKVLPNINGAICGKCYDEFIKKYDIKFIRK